MKLKTLLVIVGLLGLASIAVFVMNRPEKRAAADSRVGQPLVATTALEQAARIKVTDANKTATLVKSNDGWRISEYYDFPADFSKLSRLVSDLTEAKLDRLVTQNPERISRLDFKDSGVVIIDASGKDLANIKLGKTAESGGRFIRFGDENKAFLARLNASIEAEPKNWADATLIAIKPEDVAKVEVTFADANSKVVASRAKKEDPFTAEQPPEGQRLRPEKINSVVSSVGSLRFSNTTDPTDPNAVAAKEHARRITITTFDGKTSTIAMGRKPEQKILKAPEAKPDGSTGPSALGTVADLQKSADTGKADPSAAAPKPLTPTTQTIPAGPVFAFVTSSDANAPINSMMQKRAFQVYEYAFTSLPAAASELFEPVPPPASTAAPAPAGATALPPESAPVPVATPTPVPQP